MRSALSNPLRRVLPLATLAVLSLVAAEADAQWKWRDKDGQINASDRPPPKDVPDKDILGRPLPELRRSATAASAPAAAGSAPAKSVLDREIEARKRSAEQEQTAKAKVDEERLAAQRSDNCRRARSHISLLDAGQRIARINDKGEREVLDDHGRAEEVRRAREIIASDCR